MKNIGARQHQPTRGILHGGCITALAMACTIAVPQAHDERVVPPYVPGNIEVLGDNKAFLVGHAVGTQNYICLPSGSAFAWSLFTPEATLFDDRDKQLITHFFSPNPLEGGTVRAAWQDSRDTSTFWGAVDETSSDSRFVRPDAIPWLRIKFAGFKDGPTGGDRLSGTTFVQRVHTVGGVAPSTGCSLATDLGKKAFIPYEADYFFYEHSRRHGHDDER
jgi:hypothetical protein